MRNNLLMFMLVLAGLAAAFWFWQTRAGESIAELPPAKAHAPAIETELPAPLSRPRPLPEKPQPVPALPDNTAEKVETAQLIEWLESMVALCLRGENSHARAMYLQLRVHKPALGDLARQRYAEIAIKEAASVADQDTKLSAMAYVALLLPREDFDALLGPLRKHWRNPLVEGEREKAWVIVEKKWVGVTADNALTPDDKIIAGAVAFVVGEHLREGDSESLRYVTDRLLAVAPKEYHELEADLPDPWLSAIFTHCERQLALSPEVTKLCFASYSMLVSQNFAYSPRLRHQAKLSMVNDAKSVFDLLAQISESLSFQDAAKALSDFLEKNDVSRDGLGLIIDALVDKFGTAMFGLALTTAFLNTPRIKDLDYSRSLAACLLDLIRDEKRSTTLYAQMVTLRSLETAFIVKRVKTKGDVRPKLLDRLGYPKKDLFRSLLSRRQGIKDSLGDVQLLIFDECMCRHVFEWTDPLIEKIAFMLEWLENEPQCRYQVLANLFRGLRDTSVEELLQFKDEVARLAECALSRDYGAPTQYVKGKSGNGLECSLTMADISFVFKLIGFPKLSQRSCQRIDTLREIYVSESANKSLVDSMRNAELAYTELCNAGYTLKK